MTVREVPLHGEPRRSPRPTPPRSTWSASTGAAPGRRLRHGADARRALERVARRRTPTTASQHALAPRRTSTGPAPPTAIRFRTQRPRRRASARTTSTARSRRLRAAAAAGRRLAARSSRASSWQADESIRRAAPRYADAVHYAVVHHTAGSNNYTRGAVRGDRARHRDLPRQGQRLERHRLQLSRRQVRPGVRGPLRRRRQDRRSARTRRASTPAPSASRVLGNYGSSRSRPRRRRRSSRLLAWRLDLAHVDPLSTLTWRPAATRGSRTACRSSCARSPAIATPASPTAPGTRSTRSCRRSRRRRRARRAEDLRAGRRRARRRGPGALHREAVGVAQPWTVTDRQLAGAQVAQGSGTGTAVDWTWDASAAPPDRYSWTIASPNARSATGALGAGAALAVQKAAASPAAVAPGETTTCRYTLTAAASVTATLVSPAGADRSRRCSSRRSRPARRRSRFTPPPGLPNGRYAIGHHRRPRARRRRPRRPVRRSTTFSPGFTATGPSLSFTLTRAPFALAFQVLRDARSSRLPAVPAARCRPADARRGTGSSPTASRAPDGHVHACAHDHRRGRRRSREPRRDARHDRARDHASLSYRNLRFRVSRARDADARRRLAASTRAC